MYLLILLMACAPERPEYGAPTTSTSGLVDTDGDGTGDVPVEAWCPPPITDDLGRWYQPNVGIADAIGVDPAYRFKLRPDGEIPLCLQGEVEFMPILWACSEGDIVVHGTGWMGLFADSEGRVAVIEWLDTVEDDKGEPVAEHVYTYSTVGDSEAEGRLWYSEC